jgi:hypothetical protein
LPERRVDAAAAMAAAATENRIIRIDTKTVSGNPTSSA